MSQKSYSRRTHLVLREKLLHTFRKIDLFCGRKNDEAETWEWTEPQVKKYSLSQGTKCAENFDSNLFFSSLTIQPK